MVDHPGEMEPALESSPGPGGVAPDLTLAEAASIFTVSSATLRRLVNAGLIPAYKVSGVRGLEWRISATALEEAGYSRREAEPRKTEDVASEVRQLTAALAAERSRILRLDGELGYALLTIGRLRGRLQEVGIDPDELFGAELGREVGQDWPPGD